MGERGTPPTPERPRAGQARKPSGRMTAPAIEEQSERKPILGIPDLPDFSWNMPNEYNEYAETRFDDLVVMAEVPHPIPSRTRP